MNQRERISAVLHYEDYDRMPILHFGYWTETLEKWAAEGHIAPEDAASWRDGNATDAKIDKLLGWDSDYSINFAPNVYLKPSFKAEVIERLPDGTVKTLNNEGMVVLTNPNARGIPTEVDHLCKTRKDWEEHYLPKFQFDEERITKARVRIDDAGNTLAWDEGGLEFLQKDEHDYHINLMVGSYYGRVRNILGVVGSSYMQAEDPELLIEMIDTIADLSYQCTKYVLEHGAKFDFGHMWEDICFKSGPLIQPAFFAEHVGPHYKRITDLLREYGIDIVSLDCDGKIDALVPIWVENGVNTMFPIEVGTWRADIRPWREQYGRELRGVGGMDKVCFAKDYAAIDAEIERLKPQIELGGFIPCPDHRIAPDAKWENVQYYTEKLREATS